MSKFLLFLLSLGLWSALSASETGLVANGGFEDGPAARPTGWSLYSSGERDGIVRRAVDGGRSGRAFEIIDDSGEKGGGVTQKIVLEPGRAYVAEVWVKAAPGRESEGAFLQVRLLKSRKIFQIPLAGAPADEYRRYQLAVPVPADESEVQLFLYTQGKPKPGVLLDDVRFYPGKVEKANAPRKLAPGEIRAAAVPFPADLTAAKFAAAGHPAVFFSADDLARTRANLTASAPLRSYLARQQGIADRFAAMSDEALYRLIPPPGADVVYGLGMNLCPAGARLTWGGWDDPFSVRGKGGVKYPNADYPDDGAGCVRDGKTYRFRARAYGFLYAALEEVVLPALADCYLLTGERQYAHAAAVLLDGIAPSYAAGFIGPLDYPGAGPHNLRGGRLQRPYYQAARGMMNFVHAVDAIAASGELAERSKTRPEGTVFDNVLRNLLWDGAVYCLGYAYDGTQLHNGHADYVRGAAAVGLLLNVPALAEPLFSDTLGLPAMLAGSVDRDGFYYESSHSYSLHAVSLYQSMADMFESARRQNWPNVPAIYRDPVMAGLLCRYFDKLEVGGRLPMTGDDGPDRAFAPPSMRVSDGRYPGLHRGQRAQLNDMWILLGRPVAPEIKAEVARFLRNAYGEAEPVPPADRRILFRLGREEFELIRRAEPEADYFETTSVLYGGKGLGILRGGRGDRRHGAQLIFGQQNNHGQLEALSWTFFNFGGEWSYDPGYYNTHYRTGWTTVGVAHQQMTVNGQSPDVAAGGGYPLAWQGEGPVRYVFAANPAAFAGEGATRFERLIGQVEAADGALAYWFDLGVVAGGKFRDDSFHSLMTRLESNRVFASTGEYSLFGEVAKGMVFTPDFRLSGYPDKSFYWKLPGEGYGLLKSPTAWQGNEGMRLVGAKPVFPLPPELEDVTLVADFPADPALRYLRADAPPPGALAGVPYLIRRDERPDETSCFVKVLHFARHGESPVAGVEPFPLEAGSAAARAWRVLLADGGSDLWILGDGKTAFSFRFAGRRCEGDGLVTFVRFDREGRPVRVVSSAATAFRADGRELCRGPRAVAGRLATVEERDGVVFTVEFDGAKHLPAGPGVLILRGGGAPSAWRVSAVEGNHLRLAEPRFPMGRFSVAPVAGKPGLFRCRPDPTQLYSLGSRLLRTAAGKEIRHRGRPVGRIAGAEKSGGALHLKLEDEAGKPLRLPDGAMVEFAEGRPGDRFEILRSLTWTTN